MLCLAGCDFRGFLLLGIWLVVYCVCKVFVSGFGNLVYLVHVRWFCDFLVFWVYGSICLPEFRVLVGCVWRLTVFAVFGVLVSDFAFCVVCLLVFCAALRGGWWLPV